MTLFGWLFILSLGGIAAYWLRKAMFLIFDPPCTCTICNPVTRKRSA